jgi:pimeloyl-ACP methyl ester carboxylesterase
MTPRITLVHGWGCDASVWRDLLPLLDGLDVEVADLGFFGRPSPPTASAAPRIAVGHSLGVLWWLALSDLPWVRLVSLNGFPRFTAASDFPQGIGARVLDRMRKRFASAPQETLAEFHIAAGAAGPALPDDTEPLANGLRILADTDGRATLTARTKDILALAARDDAIVPAAMSASAFAALPTDNLRWIENGGHLLPLSHPHACAALIAEAIAS